MPTREDMIATIDRAFAARAAGDVEVMNAIWAEGATYAMEGAEELMTRYPTGPGDAHAAIERLADLLEAADIRRVDTIVEGNRAAVLWRANFSNGRDAPRTLQLFSRWEFDDAGRVTAMHEYADTATIAALIAG